MTYVSVKKKLSKMVQNYYYYYLSSIKEYKKNNCDLILQSYKYS